MFNREKVIADTVTVRSIAETTAAALGPDDPATKETQYRARVWTDSAVDAGVQPEEIAKEAKRRGFSHG